MEEVVMREPKSHELVIRMVASGVCHTDLHFGDLSDGVLGLAYAKVLGHEGKSLNLDHIDTILFFETCSIEIHLLHHSASNELIAGS
jgi:hypothetical protein